MTYTLRALRYNGGKYDVQVEVTRTPDGLELDEILNVEEVSRDPVLLVEDIEPGLEEAVEEMIAGLPLEDFARAPDDAVVNWGSVSEVVTNPVAETATRSEGEGTMEITLNLKGTHKGTAKFAIGRNTIRFPLAVFPNGTAPTTLEIMVEDGALVVPVAKAKLTKVERAAARAALTPEQKVAIAKAKADKAAKQLAKLQGELAL
jgi:hypothetical protein